MDTVEDKDDEEYNQSSSPPSIGKEPEGEDDHNQVVVPEAVDCRVCKDLDRYPKVYYVYPKMCCSVVLQDEDHKVQHL